MKKLASLSLLAVVTAVAQQPKFDLADVHVSKTAYWFANNTAPALRDGFYTYRDATLMQLIQAAYGVPEDSVAAGPSWIKSDLFDVIAKVPEGTTMATANLMLQSLLAERLGLEIRKEMHPAKEYVLSVGKGGSKLKRSPGTAEPGCKAQPMGPINVTDRASIPNQKFTCVGQTSKQITEVLRQMAGGYTTYLDHEVVDATKLEGAWDFDLEFTPAPLMADKGKDGITIFDAVKQLGLSLDLQDVPVASMVVASVNRKPTPNVPEVTTALAIAAPQFEVAVIKPVESGGGRPTMRGIGYRGGSELRLGGPLRFLIAQAFQIQPNAEDDVLIGLPKSADTKVWEIQAKLPISGEGAPLVNGQRPQPPPLSVQLEMLRGLLVERFGLKTHTENREVTVYALMLDGKHKLTKADPNERSDCRPDPNAPKPFPNLGTMVNCKNLTMAEFARNLEQATGFFDHPIVDATGLEGGWNFYLGWSRLQGPRAPNPNQPGGAAVAAEPSDTMTSYEALQRELGLKLVKQKRSIPVIVVDHVADEPTE